MSWRTEREKGEGNHENFFLCDDTNTLFTKLSEKLLNEKGDGTKVIGKYEQLEAMFKQ